MTPSEAARPIPRALYSCKFCAEDYSWPAEDLFWYDSEGAWICGQCWETADHGVPTICLKDEIKQTTAELRAQLAAVTAERDVAQLEWCRVKERLAAYSDACDALERLLSLCDLEDRHGRLVIKDAEKKAATDALAAIAEGMKP